MQELTLNECDQVTGGVVVVGTAAGVATAGTFAGSGAGAAGMASALGSAGAAIAGLVTDNSGGGGDPEAMEESQRSFDSASL